MSGAYDEYMELLERGLSSIPETYVCSSHIDDEAIRHFINRRGVKGKCSYCKKSTKTVSLEKLMFYISDGIRHFYTDPANFMSYESAEGGYLGNVYSASELLDEQIELDITNNRLYDDIHSSLDPSSAWANEYEYHDSEADYRMQQWDDFKNIVKNKSRFFIASKSTFKFGSKKVSLYRILKEIGKMVTSLKMIKRMDHGTILYRCRQHKFKNEIKGFREIASPPDKYAVYANRMSPAGISMFYSAFDIDTAMKETLDFSNKENPFYSIASFKTKRDFIILDLSTHIMPSIFEQRQWKNYYAISFINSFIKDVTKMINRDDSIHVEYVPTQIIAEYFRLQYKNNHKKIDGVIYPSSRNESGKSCVLFLNHKESLNELEFISSSLRTKKIRLRL